jgi:membrane-associated protease RseP (regulator of RpoE activity)
LPSAGEEPLFPPAQFEPPAVPAPPVPLLPEYVERPRFQHKWWKHIALFLGTFVTTTLVGAERYAHFLADFGRAALTIDLTHAMLGGLWYSGIVLAILGAHEMGHYLACRYYKLDATLPYFLPLWFGPDLGIQSGTLGAVIRIREPFRTRRILFDVGVAGPIAGFLVVVPTIFIGMWLSNLTTLPDTSLMYIGKPLLFRFARWVVFGPIPDGSIVNLHPMVYAAWFGMLATALNLLPFGQLDGGHITYAALTRHSTRISFATVSGAVIMTAFTRSWLIVTIMMLVMVRMFGLKHPHVIDETEPLDAGRLWLAVFALVILVICFMPIPIYF